MFSEYHLLLDNQVREIKGSLNRSLQTQFTLINGADVFKLLHYKVSSVGFNRLMDEYKNGEFLYPDPDCNCRNMIRDGYPCYHEIKRFVDGQIPIPESSIHVL